MLVNIDDINLWFDIDRNKRHLKYDGTHYVCDNYLFNRCMEMSLEIRELNEKNEKLLKMIDDLQVAPCCGKYCWMELPDRMRDLGIEVPE